MAKAPAFQFYVKDWLCDPELRLASVTSRGAWIDILCFMWENSKRGKLTATPLKFARLISGTLDEALHFLNEIYEYEFGDIEFPENLSFPLTEEDCNTKVTVINRRMYSEYKDRQNTRLRVKKYRDKKNETKKKQESNKKVTVTSPSPSSTTKNNTSKEEAFSLPSQEEINESSTPKIKSDLDKICEALYSEKIFPKVHAFKNSMLKKGKNERAILHTLSRCYLKKEFKKDAGPWAYCEKIIQIENGNFNERDHLKAI